MTMIERLYKDWVFPPIERMSRDDAEIAHEWALRKLRTLQGIPFGPQAARYILEYYHPNLETRVFGIDFPNPLGLAPGFAKAEEILPKNGGWLLQGRTVAAFGWGFYEVGAITMYDQLGNDRPRVLRSIKHQSLWNWMGFNNPGADALEAALYRTGGLHSPIPVGMNVGKSKITQIEKAAEDYYYTIMKLWWYFNFVVVNVSSPNTLGLRDLQGKEYLEAILARVCDANRAATIRESEPLKPIGVKIAPDLTDEEMADVVAACRKYAVSFIVIGNTTVSRDGCAGWRIRVNRGGVSGRPLQERARKKLEELWMVLKGKIPLVSAGGIDSGEELVWRITHGASLCQALSAWPFEGPDFAKRVLRHLTVWLQKNKFASVGDAVGCEGK